MRRRNQRLTFKFWLYEFMVSSDHPAAAQKLDPSEYEVDCLKLLCESCWQPVRDRWGRIDIESGFRSDELNLLVGGEPDSDHLLGAAGDGVPMKARIKRVYKWIVRNHLPYRQCIWYKDRGMIHMSINLPGKLFKHENWVERG